MTTEEPIAIDHDPAAQRFEARIGRALARADYRLDGSTMLMLHTEVPPQFEGRGLASRLVRAAFDHAQANGLKVRPICSYVAAWVRRHPEVAPLLER
jgi:predicted GNAT family acetyltransferase